MFAQSRLKGLFHPRSVNRSGGGSGSLHIQELVQGLLKIRGEARNRAFAMRPCTLKGARIRTCLDQV